MMTPYFSVTNRNPGDWDIYDEHRRLYTIRTDENGVYVTGRNHDGIMSFNTLSAAMTWIVDQLMH